MQPEHAYLRPLNLSDLLDGIFRLYRRNFLTFIGAAALILIPFGVFQLLLIFGLQETLLANMFDPNGFGNPAFGPLAMFGSGYVMASVMLSLFQNVIAIPAMYGALVWAAAQTTQQRSISLLGAYDYGAGRMLALIGASMLLALVFIVVLGIPFGMIVGWGVFATTSLSRGGSDVSSMGFIPLLFLFLLIGLVVLLVLSIKLIFTPQAIVLEGNGAWAAFRRSWDLTGGSFWRIFGILLLVFMMTFILSFIVSAFGQAISVAIMFTDSFNTGSLATSQVVSLLFETVANVIIYPVYGLATTLLYFDLRARREGYDLQLMTENIARSFERQ